MGTMEVQQPDLPALVTEADEILAQDAHAARNVAEIALERDRLPVSTQILTARRARADPRQLRVVGRDVAPVISAVGVHGQRYW